MLAAWARDEELRAADAVVAIAPATDSTLGSPTLRGNIASDPMLGPSLGRMAKMAKLSQNQMISNCIRMLKLK